MLRRLIFYLSTAGWARRIVTHWPVARRMALRFAAGETAADALRATRELNARGLTVTLDYLGEGVTHAEETAAVVATYVDLIARIQAESLRAGVSLKPTHLGLNISEDLCVTNLRHILSAAQPHAIPVAIDMEDSPYTDATLRIYRTMRDEYDFDVVGTVIQANLRRSADDMRALAAEGSHIRLVKGAYFEPPQIAFVHKAEVDAHFIELADLYLGTPSDSFLAVATHDDRMIAAALESAARHKVPPSRYEFQMLYGVRPARQAELAAAGHAMRVYVPFGEAWYPYLMRRLAERPANLLFFARAFFSR